MSNTRMYIVIAVFCILIVISIVLAVVLAPKEDSLSNPIQETLPPVEEPSLVLPKDGLVAWYNIDSLENNKLIDLSGNGNDTKEITGELVKNNDNFSGTVETGILFNEKILPPVYTLIHLAKYNGSVKGRIFASKTVNQLSGFWAGNAGVSHFDQWKTSSNSSINNSNWLLSTDTNAGYRANGVNVSTKSNKTNGTRFGVNDIAYKGEKSDFAIREIIVYDRELSQDEIKDIEDQIIEKYSLKF